MTTPHRTLLADDDIRDMLEHRIREIEMQIEMQLLAIDEADADPNMPSDVELPFEKNIQSLLARLEVVRARRAALDPNWGDVPAVVPQSLEEHDHQH